MTAIGAFAKDWGLRDQIRRAAVSTLSNIAEGFDCFSNRDFIRFLQYAYRSCSEIQSQLYIAHDQNYIDKAEWQKLYDMTTECKNLTMGFIRYLKKTPDPRKEN